MIINISLMLPIYIGPEAKGFIYRISINLLMSKRLYSSFDLRRRHIWKVKMAMFTEEEVKAADWP